MAHGVTGACADCGCDVYESVAFCDDCAAIERRTRELIAGTHGSECCREVAVLESDMRTTLATLDRERMARFADAWMAIGLFARVLKEEIADESWRHRGPPDYERYRVIALQTLAQKLAIPPAPEDKP